MSKSNKELAVEVTIALIEANKVQLVATPHGPTKQTNSLKLDEVVAVLETVHSTIEKFDVTE